jgi:hypothetical protein
MLLTELPEELLRHVLSFVAMEAELQIQNFERAKPPRRQAVGMPHHNQPVMGSNLRLLPDGCQIGWRRLACPTSLYFSDVDIEVAQKRAFETTLRFRMGNHERAEYDTPIGRRIAVAALRASNRIIYPVSLVSKHFRDRTMPYLFRPKVGFCSIDECGDDDDVLHTQTTNKIELHAVRRVVDPDGSEKDEVAPASLLWAMYDVIKIDVEYECDGSVQPFKCKNSIGLPKSTTRALNGEAATCGGLHAPAILQCVHGFSIAAAAREAGTENDGLEFNLKHTPTHAWFNSKGVPAYLDDRAALVTTWRSSIQRHHAASSKRAKTLMGWATRMATERGGQASVPTPTDIDEGMQLVDNAAPLEFVLRTTTAQAVALAPGRASAALANAADRTHGPLRARIVVDFCVDLLRDAEWGEWVAPELVCAARVRTSPCVVSSVHLDEDERLDRLERRRQRRL